MGVSNVLNSPVTTAIALQGSNDAVDRVCHRISKRDTVELQATT